MYQTIFYFHVAVSICALILGVTLMFIASRNLISKREYVPGQKVMGQFYVISLYVQLAIGLFMYFYPLKDKALTESNAIDPGNSPELRFWEIEHIGIMVFALFIVQVGCIFIGQTKDSTRKNRLSLFYFGLPLILMIFSMVMSMR